MKILAVIIAINLLITTAVSANEFKHNNKHGNKYKQQSHISKNYKHHGLSKGPKKKHFNHHLKHRKYRHSPRPYVYYERPLRWEHRHHHAHDSLIITSGVIGFIMGTHF